MINKITSKIKIKDLISIIPFSGLIDDPLYDNLQKFIKKFINIETYIKYLNIQIVVNNIDTAQSNFSSKSFVDVLNKEEYCFLKIIFHANELKMNEVATYVTFIEDKNYNPSNYYIFNYLLHLSNFVLNEKVDFSNFNKRVEEILEKENKKLSTHVLGARKSIIKTVYGIEDMKRVRNNKDIIKNKKVQADSTVLTCICGLKHEITSKNIDMMINIDERSQNIILNCLHDDTNFEGGKFFVKKSKYRDFFSTNPIDSDIKNWFINNFEELKNHSSN